ncbi:Putative RNA recognition motif domain, tetratricopeptide-like helical domain superfamily [Septoria linicola]|uniref:U4/U6 snRNA-associated-splicing factor PRP24 n=1 Tax=Septoria linicola TaxID=215465 RepID=A0A9Q9ARB2_9PEZI|nr:putative RNA recognition motif domain, tetratricopeptide-like helical domain superfamily [Septoria linicola]USW53989.1 Putative RNA recognition motif domain, tetratricopeptide-like helical domain superfamily [Septoria linicola]
MDINALLSPDEGVSQGRNPDAASPTPSAGSSATAAARAQAAESPSVVQRGKRPAGGKRTASGLSQELSRSPERHISPKSEYRSAHRPAVGGAQQPPQQQQRHHQHQHYYAVPIQAAPPNFRPLPPTTNPVHSPGAQQQYAYAQRPPVAHRPSPTPQVGSLADLPSAQQRHQTTRTYSDNNIHTQSQSRSQSHVRQHSTSSPPVARSISRQSLADLTMAEAPAQTPPPREFESAALSEDESQRVSELLAHLGENSYAYQYYVELINLLHKGFLAHVSSPSVGAAEAQSGEPRTYALFTEMRRAREAMDSRFAVGEAIWVDWLNDEILAATNTEERMEVLELCRKAVVDEPASVKLWQAYVDFVSEGYKACHQPQNDSRQGWSEEDREMCKELFDHDTLMTVLEQAASATQWRIDQSHTLWDRFAEAVYAQVPQQPTQADGGRVHNLFINRLKTPQARWAETMQTYWPIISRFEGANWEAAIAQVNQQAEPAKICYAIREDHEFKLQRATESGDAADIHHQLVKYLKDEKYYAIKKKTAGPFDYELRCALYERAVLFEPTNLEWWLDYVDFLVTDPKSTSLLSVIERATRHCPWSGELWARRILRADVEQQSRDDIGNIKHRATNTGLLDVGGLEEYVKMLQEWCSYLRRYAFRESSTEDDVDTAEFGIHSTLEDVHEAGKRVYGADFQGDPLFRLEQIQIKFFAEAKRFDQARDSYKTLSARLGGSADFWYSYYNFEIWMWGYDRVREERRVERQDNAPTIASNVVREALRQRNIDFPDRVLRLYTNHFQQHESGVVLQHALADAREFSKKLAMQRVKEQEETAAAAAAQQQEQLAAAAQSLDITSTNVGEKRKREDESANGEPAKKAKTSLETVHEEGHTEASASASAHMKRDREHNTITLRGLPADVSDFEIKKFFRDCGNPVSISIVQDKDSKSASAVVEFESEDDVTTAKTRSGKEIRSHEVRIQSGSGSTLYVTNYPAEYDEDAIRSLFKSYGEIVSVRLPSLKFNSRRRFAYVQFLTTEMANAAAKAMDGKKLDGMHTLLAKIADPDAKKQRGGAASEGREIIVKNSDREASEQQVRDFFSQYGEIERINLVRLVNNRATGTLFITYTTTEETAAAIEGANNKPFHDRILKVELVQPKGRAAAPHERAGREDVLVKQTRASATPVPSANGARRGSDVSMQSAPREDDDGYKTVKERKIAIFNLPDTVNDARIKTAMEQYGPITKIQLRREKQGAIIEFRDVKDAFRVRTGVDVSSLGPEASTGDVGDLLARQNKKKIAGTTASSTGSSLKPAFAPPQATRPGGARGGRRGGLGFKRGGFASSAATARSEGAGDSNATVGPAKKSNGDFRSMLEASKKKPDETNGDAAAE